MKLLDQGFARLSLAGQKKFRKRHLDVIIGSAESNEKYVKDLLKNWDN